jgi:hypothetical protein
MAGRGPHTQTFLGLELASAIGERRNEAPRWRTDWYGIGTLLLKK